MKCIPLHVLLPPHLLRFAHFFTPLVYQMHCKRKAPPVVRAAKLQRRWKKRCGGVSGVCCASEKCNGVEEMQRSGMGCKEA